jgi:hypothetical protein
MLIAQMLRWAKATSKPCSFSFALRTPRHRYVSRQIQVFTASVLPPGAAMLLPAEAISLPAGPWQSSTELIV